MSTARNKKIKAQHNSLCTASIICEMNAITLVAGTSCMNLIDITDKGITIQTDAEKPLTFMTTDIYGPYFQWNLDPLVMFLPMFSNKKSIANFQLPFSDNAGDIVSTTAIFAIISGA